MPQKDALFLVTGATGTQGGATARALLAAGHRVRILTRNPDAPAAKALAGLGAEVARGDMAEPAGLAAAMQGVYGVFSVQRPDADGSDSERRHGLALIEAAKTAGVRHFVHTSVCQAGTHESFPRWDEGYWAKKYWTDKWDVEQAVRSAGFEHWTILRPSFIMENFKHAKAQFLFPQLQTGEIVTPVRPDSRLQLIAGEDIGAFARAAFENPDRFGGKAIELAADDLTYPDMAKILADTQGKPVAAKTLSPEAATAAGIFPTWVRSQEWINDVRYQVDMSDAASYGVPMTDFATWAKRHAGEIVVGA
jgi:uncharacterized protein YbjT (DUF2867 family)